MADSSEARQRNKTYMKQPPICFRCGETGHKDERCFNPPPDPETLEYRLSRPEVKKRLENIQCKKCLQFGHYANFCPSKKRAGMPGAYFGPHPWFLNLLKPDEFYNSNNGNNKSPDRGLEQRTPENIHPRRLLQPQEIRLLREETGQRDVLLLVPLPWLKGPQRW